MENNAKFWRDKAEKLENEIEKLQTQMKIDSAERKRKTC
jgi:hypothetical protein